MAEASGLTDRRNEGFVIPDHEGVLHYGDRVQIIGADGSSARTLVVDTTYVSGRPGDDGFIKHINTIDESNNEKVVLYPGQRVKWLGDANEIEIIE